MVDMAIAGHNIEKEKNQPLPEENRKIIINKLTRSIWAPDQMILSDRIHGAGKKIKQDIIYTVTSSIRNADTVYEMAKKLYDGYNSGTGVLTYAQLPAYLEEMRKLAVLAAHGDRNVTRDLEKAIKVTNRNIEKIDSKMIKAAYKKLLDACKEGNLKEKLIERAAYVSIQEKSRYHAMRIARTESQRAWFQGMVSRYKTDPLVFGFKWRLSSNHKFLPFDICDVCANMDVDFGKGIYYKNRMPMNPLHPHCMCLPIPVFITDIKNGTRFQPEKAREYLDSLPNDKKQILFGKDGLEKYRKDRNWQKHLRGWGGLKNPYAVLNATDFELQSNTLPNFKQAVISDDKIFKYVLNKEHPIGGNKAIVFESALGYNQSNGEALINNIKNNLHNNNSIPKGNKGHGETYEVNMMITGPNGKTANVVTGWIVDNEKNFPRLTSAYVKEKKVKTVENS